jgi:hypothetical protein
MMKDGCISDFLSYWLAALFDGCQPDRAWGCHLGGGGGENPRHRQTGAAREHQIKRTALAKHRLGRSELKQRVRVVQPRRP